MRITINNITKVEPAMSADPQGGIIIWGTITNLEKLLVQIIEDIGEKKLREMIDKIEEEG